MARALVVLLASLFAGCASVDHGHVVTLPAFFVCGRDVYWFEHPPIKTFKAPRFSAPKSVVYSPSQNYPYEARLKLWEGSMLLELQITSQGSVDHVEILQHTRYPLLELAAKQGFRRWRFTPGTASRVRIPVTFSWHCAEYPKQT
jgi:TonB family protein